MIHKAALLSFRLSVKLYGLLRFGQSGPVELRSIARELTALEVIDEENVLKQTGDCYNTEVSTVFFQGSVFGNKYFFIVACKGIVHNGLVRFGSKQ